MNVRNCRKCGKIFNYVAGPHICPRCRESLEADFQRVKEYVREHKGATITEVSEECEVEVNQIHQWLREERLELEEGSGVILRCENCNAVITTGRFCAECKREVSMGLRDAARSYGKQDDGTPVRKPNHDGDKMRYLSR